MVCFMHHYITESGSSLFDYGCSSQKGCLQTVDSVFGKRNEGHHVKCTVCCNNTKRCNEELTCDKYPQFITLPRECSDIIGVHLGSGIYTIYPNGSEHNSVFVFCEGYSDGYLWTVIQRRFNGTVNFYRGWSDYKHGFGNPNGEYWLGNDILHEMTSNRQYQLRIIMVDFNGTTAFANYLNFSMADETEGYKLSVSTYTGDAGDSFGAHTGYKFTTFDRDNDVSNGNCAESYKGGWWYASCHWSNLNGIYYPQCNSTYGTGINWYAWLGHYCSLKSVTMMIRKINN